MSSNATVVSSGAWFKPTPYQMNNSKVLSEKNIRIYKNGRVHLIDSNGWEKVQEPQFAGPKCKYLYIPCYPDSNQGKRKTFALSRLVAEAFLPKPEGLKGSGRLTFTNGNPGDVRLENIEWITSSIEKAETFKPKKELEKKRIPTQDVVKKKSIDIRIKECQSCWEPLKRARQHTGLCRDCHNDQCRWERQVDLEEKYQYYINKAKDFHFSKKKIEILEAKQMGFSSSEVSMLLEIPRTSIDQTVYLVKKEIDTKLGRYRRGDV